LVRGDIRDERVVRAVLEEHRPTRVIHLAAFQTPDCVAHPFDGMDINVGGTAILFKVAASLGTIERMVFASSAAVYGPRSLYPDAGVFPDGPLRPSSLYGYWKTAGEGIAQAFHAETGISTVSLRLAITYGPGRDLGLTSAETTAIKAAALGVPFEMPYTGKAHYHYVQDMGAGFAQAALAPHEGYGVFNLPGTTSSVPQFLSLLEKATRDLAPERPCHVGIREAAPETPIIWDLDHRETVQRFPDMPLTPLELGIQASLVRFTEMAANKELSPTDVQTDPAP